MSPPPLHPHPDTGRGRLPVLGGGVPWSPGLGLPAATARGRLPEMLMRPRLLIPKGQVISPTGGAGRPAPCPAPCRLPSGLTNRAWAFRKPAVLDPSQDFAQGQLFVYSAPFFPPPPAPFPSLPPPPPFR